MVCVARSQATCPEADVACNAISEVSDVSLLQHNMEMQEQLNASHPIVENTLLNAESPPLENPDLTIQGPDPDEDMPEELTSDVNDSVVMELLEKFNQTEGYTCSEKTFPNYPANGYICGPRSERFHVAQWLSEPQCWFVCAGAPGTGCEYYWRAFSGVGFDGNGNPKGACRCCKSNAQYYTSSNPWHLMSCCR